MKPMLLALLLLIAVSSNALAKTKSVSAYKAAVDQVEVFMIGERPKRKYDVIRFVNASQTSFYYFKVGSDPMRKLKEKAYKLGGAAVIDAQCGTVTHVSGSSAGSIAGNAGGYSSSVDSSEVPVCQGYVVKWK